MTDLASSNRSSETEEFQLSEFYFVKLSDITMVFEKKMLTHGDPDDEVPKISYCVFIDWSVCVFDEVTQICCSV